MADLLTAAQMRALELTAISSGVVTGLELMERAGRGVVAAVFEAWPELAQSSYRAVVLCGPGNNGGDGFVIARLLRDWGWEVDVYLLGDPARLPPDAKANHDRWRARGMVHPLLDQTMAESLNGAALVVDALFGTGLARRLEGLEATAVALRDCVFGEGQAKVVAVDIPSGLNADSGCYAQGTPPAQRIAAHLTVSFHTAKLGHYLAEGPTGCGRLVVKDIGLPSVPDWAAVRLARPDVAGLQKRGGAHKFSHGHGFVLCGGVGHGGAARLAARSALRIGAGLVTLGCPPAAILENASQLNAVMLRRVADGAGLTEILEDDRINALCVGPGLGCRAETRDLVRAVLLARRATVVDADGLSAFAADPKELFAMVHAACVLTPHTGEFARLFPEIAARLADGACSKVDAVREAAARAGCVVLLKGADTVIATPEGRACLHAAAYERVAPWLATAGSGDVLAGFITGLLARGFAPYEAAQTAAWVHVECARSFGVGLISEDLPEVLPSVLRRLQE